MKHLTLSLIALIFTLILTGCENDNPITTGGQSFDRLIFEKDSIGISTELSGVVSVIKSYNVGINARKIRVEFDAYTNLLDNSTNLRSLYLSCQAHYTNFYSLNLSVSSELNKQHILTIDNTNSAQFNLNFICNINYANPVEVQTNGIGIIQFGNIKVYSVN